MHENQKLLFEIYNEAEKGAMKFGAFNSSHELYGVLKEEVDEFWHEVKNNKHVHAREAQRRELLQIAAVAFRGIKELDIFIDKNKK